MVAFNAEQKDYKGSSAKLHPKRHVKTATVAATTVAASVNQAKTKKPIYPVIIAHRADRCNKKGAQKWQQSKSAAIPT